MFTESQMITYHSKNNKRSFLRLSYKKTVVSILSFFPCLNYSLHLNLEMTSASTESSIAISCKDFSQTWIPDPQKIWDNKCSLFQACNQQINTHRSSLDHHLLLQIKLYWNIYNYTHSFTYFQWVQSHYNSRVK